MTGAGEGTLLRTAVTLQRARLARARRMKRTRPSPSSLQVPQGWHWRPAGGATVVRLAGLPPSIHVFLPTLKPRKPGMISDGQWHVECPGTEQVMGLLSLCVLYTCVTELPPWTLGRGDNVAKLLGTVEMIYIYISIIICTQTLVLSKIVMMYLARYI